MKPHITALCLTYGRVDFLNEAIQMFLNQTYDGPKQLIVFNSFTKQRLAGNFPNVRIINAPERPPTLGDCRNQAIQLANQGLIVIWDDDDAYLPNHLENFANHYDEGVDWIWHSRQFYMESYKLKQIVQGSCNSLAFTKAAWEKVGGYPNRNSGEDRDFVSKLTQACQGKKVHLEDADLSFLYHWGQGVYHLSGQGDDQKGMQSGHDRIAAHTEDLARRHIIPTGTVLLNPNMQHDYVRMRDEYLAERKALALKKNSVCFVQLGRFGDIVNMLPLCLHCNNNYSKPYLMVSREFASILDGVSYVEPYIVDIPFDTLQPALDLARRTFSHVIQTQIWARDYQCERQTDAYNKESWRQAGFLNQFSNGTWLPVFDRRNEEREGHFVKKVESPGKPIVLVNLTDSMSSPFPKGQLVHDILVKELREKFSIVGVNQLDRIYDLVAIMEKAALIISIDSAQLHLAACTGTRVIAITNPVPWLGTSPRAHHVYAQFNYDQISADPSLVINAAKAALAEWVPAINTAALCATPQPAPKRDLYHAVQIDPARVKSIDRLQRAKATWDVLYRNGVFPRHLSTSSRTSADIGDNRNLPYLKDVLAYAALSARDEDIIFFTNDDNELHPDLPDYLKFHVSLYGACASFRSEFSEAPPINPPAPHRYEAGCSHSAGQDLFAFTKAWMTEHWNEIPDFLLGASEWDWCLTMIIRKEKKIQTTQHNIRAPIFPAEIPYGYVAHEIHRPGWIDPAVVNASKAQQHNQKLFSEWLAVNLPSFKMNQYPGTPPVRHSANGKEILIIRRSQALGDVLASTCVATALMDMGHEVEFQAAPSTHPILARHPRLRLVSDTSKDCDVNLDGAYENHPARTRSHMAEMYIEKANDCLKGKGIHIPSLTNFAPRLVSDTELQKVGMTRLSNYPKPWVMICPRSESWVNRTIPNDIWQEAAPQIAGTKFWLGLKQAPHGIVDLVCRRLDLLIEYIGLADLFVTVDTGPMHIAAAMGAPILVVQQAMSPALRLSDQRDWYSIDPPLNCLNCQKDVCPINALHPPCQKIRPDYLAYQANRRLRITTSEDISAVIAVHKPKLELLNRTIAAVLPQVSEIVIVGDLDTPWPIQGITSPTDKIFLVRKNTTRTGYGKKINFGARHTAGKYLWTVNDDCFPNADAAQHMRSLMQSDQQIGLVSHTLWYPDGTIQYANKFRPRGACGFGHIDHRGSKVRYTEPVESECACGASVLLRRKAFYDAGAFDEDFYLYSDDDALSLQVRKAGYKIIFTPHTSGIHIEHQSTGTMAQIAPLLEKANQTFLRKWKRYFDHNPDPDVIGNFNYE